MADRETTDTTDQAARRYADAEVYEARTDPAELMCDAGEIDGETLWKIDGMGYYDDMWF